MNRRQQAAIAVGAVLAAIAVGALVPRLFDSGTRSGKHLPEATLAVSDALGSGDASGFARAFRPRPFTFPEDHGPHPEFRTEWWYYTGNLETAAGRHVGFQLTFFRVALAPPDRVASIQRTSAWAASQLYLAHFALTDTTSRHFYAGSRMTREALGLAGTGAGPFRIWVEDWSAESQAAGGFPVRLRAADGEVAIDLLLESGKPVVLQGDRGWSAKGREPGNASYYYSFTRLPARGTVRVRGASLAVSGLAWMDREWSTSALGPDLVGWDWFALQLDDGRDVMVYRLRRRDGSVDPHSTGTLIAGDGTARPIDHVALEVLDHWTSPTTRVRYPSRWRLSVPAEDLRLEIAPRVANQELNVETRYWEGAVRVEDLETGRPIAGQGYVELVGYGE